VAWQARVARPSLSVPQAGRPVLVSKSSRERLWFGLVPSCLFRQRGPRGRFRGPANAGGKNDAQIGWAVGGRALRRAEHAHPSGGRLPARPSKQRPRYAPQTVASSSPLRMRCLRNIVRGAHYLACAKMLIVPAACGLECGFNAKHLPVAHVSQR
jgi:hypothetical protein